MHHWQEAGVAFAPPALAVGEGAAALFTLLLWGITLGLLVAWRWTFGAMLLGLANEMDRVSFGAPVVGKVRPLHLLAEWVRGVNYAIEHGLSLGVKGSEHATVYLVNHAWHLLTWTAHEIVSLGLATGAAFQGFVHHTIPHLVARGVHAFEHRLTRAFQQLGVVQVRTHNQVSALRADVHSLGHATTVALPRDIGRVRAREGRLEHDLDAVKAHLDRIAKLVAFAGLSAFMIRWLGRNGLRWLRCPALARLGSRIGCGGFALLEDILFFSVEAVAISDLCRFAALVTGAAEEIRPLLMDFVDAEEALVGCHGASKPPALGLPALQLPPTNAGLRLAA